MRNFSCLLLGISIFCNIGCGKLERHAALTGTKKMAAPGLPEFEYPAHYTITPDSGKGESKWTYVLVGKKGEPRIEASGFFHIPDSIRKDGETSLASLRTMAMAKQGQKSTVEVLLDGRILRVTSNAGELLETILWHVPYDDANGAAIKSIRVQYRHENAAVVETVVQSWIAGIRESEREFQ